jgi:hypothetical protein
LLVSENIPPDDRKVLAAIIEQHFATVEEEIATLTAFLTALMVEFARQVAPSPAEGSALLTRIGEQALKDIEQARANRAKVRELVQLLLRKADPWKPDA